MYTYIYMYIQGTGRSWFSIVCIYPHIYIYTHHNMLTYLLHDYMVCRTRVLSQRCPSNFGLIPSQNHGSVENGPKISFLCTPLPVWSLSSASWLWEKVDMGVTHTQLWKDHFMNHFKYTWYFVSIVNRRVTCGILNEQRMHTYIS